MNFKSIKLYENSDVFAFSLGNVEYYGYSSSKTIGEMIDIAIQNNCKIIMKQGKGKWYLKGQDKEYDNLKTKLETNNGKYPRRKCWLIDI